jgi:hypothetical protein
MIDKAFGLKQVAEDVSQDIMTQTAAGMVLFAETDEDRQIALNIFGQTVTGLMAHAMSQLLLSEEDFRVLTQTIEELNDMAQEAEDN